VQATATSGLPVTLAPAPMSVCTVSGNTFTFTGIGTCTIVATQAGNADYLAAPPQTEGVTVVKMPTTLVAKAEGVLYSSVSATLKSATGAPISGAVITFTTGARTIGTAITNANGVATKSTLGLSFGSTYQARYPGSARYAASSGSAAL